MAVVAVVAGVMGQVADMKNSVKDRMNAQSSCAGAPAPGPAPST